MQPLSVHLCKGEKYDILPVPTSSNVTSSLEKFLKDKTLAFKGKGFVYLTVHKQQPPKNIYHQKCTCIDTSAK